MENGERPKRDLGERTFESARPAIRLLVALDRGALAPGRQRLRAGTPVRGNYREGEQARSKAELVAPIGNGLKEVDEAAYWLELMAAEQVGAAADVAAALDEATQRVAIFTTLKRRAGGKA